MDSILGNVQENVQENRKENVQEESKNEVHFLRIYQTAVMMAAALLFALVPSLLVWRFHIMSVSDPAVVIGLACCYAFAVILTVFNVYQWKNRSLV